MVLRRFLTRLIERHLRDGDIEGYRMYLNLQGYYFRGFPPCDPWKQYESEKKETILLDRQALSKF